VTKEWIPSPAQATTFDLADGPDQETTFDGDGTVFITPEDSYGLTDVYNKYLLYPKINILGGSPPAPAPVPQPPAIVPWVNDVDAVVDWVNSVPETVNWVNEGSP
jgi:hypothetical protein